MSVLEAKVKKLEDERKEYDLKDFFTELTAELYPDLNPPLTFESYRGKSVKEYFATVKILRPKILAVT